MSKRIVNQPTPPGITTKVVTERYLWCPRCGQDSIQNENICCPRGSCEGYIAGKVIITTTTELIVDKSIKMKTSEDDVLSPMFKCKP